MHSRPDPLTLFIAISAVLICWYLLISRQPLDIVQEAQTYCTMVHDHKWPDFHHVYAKQCHKDGSVNLKYVYNR